MAVLGEYGFPLGAPEMNTASLAHHHPPTFVQVRPLPPKVAKLCSPGPSPKPKQASCSRAGCEDSEALKHERLSRYTVYWHQAASSSCYVAPCVAVWLLSS